MSPTPRLLTRTATRMQGLLFSSRPHWALMPGFVADNFVENLLFLLSALERHGIAYIAHFGTLLGSARLAGVNPWDEDADIYVIGEDRASICRKLFSVLHEHGFALIYDPRGFYWVRQQPWWAGQGHIGLSFLPAVAPKGSSPPTHPADDRIAHEQLYPLRKHPFHGTWIWGPFDPDAVIERLYGESGSQAVMARFQAPRVRPETTRFWHAARGCEPLDWPAISQRFRARTATPAQRYAHVATFPWWWWNGAYNIGIKRLRQLGERLGASDTEDAREPRAPRDTP